MTAERSKRLLLQAASYVLNAVVIFCGCLLLMASADAVAVQEGPGDGRGTGAPVGTVGDAPGGAGKPVTSEEDKQKPKNGDKLGRVADKKGEAPMEEKDDPLAEALEKIKEADLKFDGKPVVIPKDTVKTLLKWGSPAKEGFKFATTNKRIKASGFAIDCGDYVGQMGVRGDYYILAATETDGIAVIGLRGRLVVFVPLEEDGVGKPLLAPSEDKEGGMGYRNTVPGYFLVSKTRRMVIKKKQKAKKEDE